VSRYTFFVCLPQCYKFSSHSRMCLLVDPVCVQMHAYMYVCAREYTPKFFSLFSRGGPNRVCSANIAFRALLSLLPSLFLSNLVSLLLPSLPSHPRLHTGGTLIFITAFFHSPQLVLRRYRRRRRRRRHGGQQ